MPQPVFYFNYKVIADELTAAGISKNDIFYFEGTPLEAVFRNFHNVAQTMLFLSDEGYGIHPARFIYNNSTTINAKAGMSGNVRFISINSGLIVITSNFFVDAFNALPAETISFLQVAMNVLPDSIPELMRDFSVRLTVDHEYAHLIQKYANNSNWMQQEYTNEKSIDFSLEHHVLEFDADMWGALGVSSSVKTYFDSLPVESRTNEMLSVLLTVSLASIQCKFFLGQQTPPTIYFNQYKHPHPIIRTISIGNRLRQLFFSDELGRTLNWQNINGNSIHLASMLLQTKGFSFVENVIMDYVKHYWDIQKYIQTTIFNNLGAFPNLTIHRPPNSVFGITSDKIFAKYDSLHDLPPILNYFNA